MLLRLDDKTGPRTLAWTTGSVVVVCVGQHQPVATDDHSAPASNESMGHPAFEDSNRAANSQRLHQGYRFVGKTGGSRWTKSANGHRFLHSSIGAVCLLTRPRHS